MLEKSRSIRKVPFGKVVAFLFIASCLVRIGESDFLLKASDLVADVSNPDPDRENGQGLDPALQDLISDLSSREKRLDEQARELYVRSRQVSEMEQALAVAISELQVSEENLSRTIEIAQQASSGDIERLVGIYTNMKPKDAAEIFEQMPPGFSAGFLTQMDPSVAAGIVSNMSPDSAFAVSVHVAGRNMDVPSN
ncbi:hypothetical protein AB0T83_03880 [Fluviibacterium sp. DFM31]|uniref:Magnesium transporter MgtE intracellular domain-containing protein n=1 Tax=Meridianimarinicoccus marinus TaxID=3231483 RepID=A0ABV3L308_9RHOB